MSGSAWIQVGERGFSDRTRRKNAALLAGETRFQIDELELRFPAVARAFGRPWRRARRRRPPHGGRGLALGERPHPWGELIAVRCALPHAFGPTSERARLLRREPRARCIAPRRPLDAGLAGLARLSGFTFVSWSLLESSNGCPHPLHSSYTKRVKIRHEARGRDRARFPSELRPGKR